MIFLQTTPNDRIRHHDVRKRRIREVAMVELLSITSLTSTSAGLDI
jgi:hypothetical protein